MNKTYLPNYNIHWTLMGGQSHNWKLIDDWYYGCTKEIVIKLKQEGDFLIWQTYPEQDNWDYLSKYLRVDVDYENILKTINKDKYVDAAIKKFPNLRLLKQDFEETLLSYLFSANKNIEGIRFGVSKLREMYGRKVRVDDKSFYLFPQVEDMVHASLKDLQDTKMGFRAKFLKSAINKLANSKISQRIGDLNEEEAREVLLRFDGVGDKIADCVLVYGLGFDNVTPLDVWGYRFAILYYKHDMKSKYSKIRNWLSNYFEGYAGWAGQFLYEYIRTTHVNKYIGKR